MEESLMKDNINTQENQQVVEDYIQELNARHAVVLVGGQCLIMNERPEPLSGQPRITFSRPSELRTFYANTPGPQGRSIIDTWLQHDQRRQYLGIVFNPEQEVPDYYNLWHGFAVEPIPGNCGLYLQHIHDNIASRAFRMSMIS